jgi:putative ABC transport system permease protein
LEQRLGHLTYLNPYIFHIDLYDLAFLGMIFIGLTFALQLLFIQRANQSANRFLGLAIGVAILWMTHVLFIDINLETSFPRSSWFPLQFSLAFGPLINFYVRKITRPECKFGFKDLLHFSPLLLELGIQVLSAQESLRTGAATYHTLTYQQLNPIMQLLAIISVIIYISWCHIMVERFYRRLKFNGGDRYRHELRWLHNSLTVFGIAWLLWIPITAADYYYHLGSHVFYPLYLLLVVITMWLATVAF